jgi:hypothetical protein
MSDATDTDGVKAARLAIYGDPDSDAFTPTHRRLLMKAIDEWYETIEAQGLSYAGLAAALRDVADEYA